MTDDILLLASAALGGPVSDARPLDGSERSVVLRAHVPGGTVVVKKYPDGTSAAFAREAAGLSALAHTPELLALDRDHGLLVMSDLGTGPTLAELLLGDDPEAAWEGALSWVAALADALGRSRGATSVFVAALGDLPADEPSAAARVGVRRLLDDVLGLPADREIDTEIDVIATLDHRDPASDVVSPTDTCPDNAVRTPDGWRFLDLEGATVHHVAYDAAYAAMPFSTCWCVFDPPPGFTDRLLDRFTTALAPHLPDVVREPGWTLAVDRACASWILAMTGWLIDGADEDRPRVGPPGVPSPSYRQLLTTRWRWGAVRLRSTLPAVAGLLAAAAAWADDEWGSSAAPVGPYRAFARDE
ncbi:hypothetical protein HP550_07825 [Cellulomonas humilata]|uniref:Aminoglycoside phosphotransferase domain-containing protein n=1 Tax=Cellulomonas humilata TaxID=144055 RepID=A0A7Y5ZZT1_9CELL|nr:phosphotransferase [Cellulomonas humilata]NUU17156.1 hypothetical protein [Cellulomonas humilata]